MYYIFRKITIVIFLIGFLILFGTVGTSDLEVELNQQIMSDNEFYGKIIVGTLIMTVGSIGYTYNNNKYLIKRR